MQFEVEFDMDKHCVPTEEDNIFQLNILIALEVLEIIEYDLELVKR
jgi:hypothetical protein